MMKMLKTIMILAFVLTGLKSASSQTVNNQPFADIDAEYVQIVGTSRLMSSKVTIQIDFGQNTKFFNGGKETQVRDKDGKLMKFNSMIDALNYMSANGYKFVQAYAFAVGSQNVYHYLMTQRKK